MKTPHWRLGPSRQSTVVQKPKKYEVLGLVVVLAVIFMEDLYEELIPAQGK